MSLEIWTPEPITRTHMVDLAVRPEIILRFSMRKREEFLTGRKGLSRTLIGL